MNKVQELALMLNGCDYRTGPSKELVKFAKDNGLVIVFGYSDDGVEFDGVFREELNAPSTYYFDADGLIENKCLEFDCPYFSEKIKNAIKLISHWDIVENRIWTYETLIPHEKFTMVEDGEEMSEGIVFSMSDLKQTFSSLCTKHK